MLGPEFPQSLIARESLLVRLDARGLPPSTDMPPTAALSKKMTASYLPSCCSPLLPTASKKPAIAAS